LNDIIVFSTSLDEHLTSLKIVFKKLKNANLKLQLDKCEFLKRETEFLGHIVRPNGVMPNPKKVKAINKFSIPNTKEEIKSFLGPCGYYRIFIPNFADISNPLTKCLRAGSKVTFKDNTFIATLQRSHTDLSRF